MNSPNIALPIYKIGDLVAFSKRAQAGMPPYKITAVDDGLFACLYQLDGGRQWWSAESLMPFATWNQQFHAK